MSSHCIVLQSLYFVFLFPILFLYSVASYYFIFTFAFVPLMIFLNRNPAFVLYLFYVFFYIYSFFLYFWFSYNICFKLNFDQIKIVAISQALLKTNTIAANNIFIARFAACFILKYFVYVYTAIVLFTTVWSMYWEMPVSGGTLKWPTRGMQLQLIIVPVRLIFFKMCAFFFFFFVIPNSVVFSKLTARIYFSSYTVIITLKYSICLKCPYKSQIDFKIMSD